ncbi:MAG: bifunctional 4-hydroxy-2-oxoglutarate aldolase/2-dehydro-3-deoxy-phosphogluconate aldolase [Myxococcota bacterium]
MTALSTRELLAQGPVIPIVVIDDAAQATDLAQALIAGGLRVIEVTLRTADALAAVRAIAREVPEAIVGVGTAVRPDQLEQALDAGAQFAVSPGFTLALVEKARDLGLPLLPGAATASEMLVAMALGIEELKFFPADAVGGTAALRHYGSVFPQLRFCPTGGITYEGSRAYLELDNVACVGGSWVASRKSIAAGDFDEITAQAKRAQALRH